MYLYNTVTGTLILAVFCRLITYYLARLYNANFVYSVVEKEKEKEAKTETETLERLHAAYKLKFVCSFAR